jgi:hypothetical protein
VFIFKTNLPGTRYSKIIYLFSGHWPVITLRRALNHTHWKYALSYTITLSPFFKMDHKSAMGSFSIKVLSRFRIFRLANGPERWPLAGELLIHFSPLKYQECFSYIPRKPFFGSAAVHYWCFSLKRTCTMHSCVCGILLRFWAVSSEKK